MTEDSLPPLLHAHFARQARRSPDAVALREGDRAVTFAELRERVQRAAGGIRARGIRPDSLVGLHVHRSIDWVVGTLAILEADATVVPLPPSDPEARRVEIASFARLDAVLDSDASPLPPGFAGAVRLAKLEECAPIEPGAPGDPERAAFVLSSSGSTGRPKLVVRSHRSFFHRLRWTWQRHPFGPGDVACQKAHSTTTHSIYELFEPLLGGAPTVIVPDAEARDLERFWAIVRERAVTRLLVVPSALRASLGMPDFRAPELEVMVLMGEHVPAALAERVVAAFPARTKLYSIYGSTEASSALVTDLRASLRPGRELPLGSPIAPEVRAVVLDPELEPVRPGAQGRLHIGGPPLFTRYLGDDAATEAVLVRPPGASAPLYDTRDEVRLDEDGALEFVARVDHMVKVRGFRVDLTEVERAMEAHPGVRQAAVVAAESDGLTSLAAYYAPADVPEAEVFRSLRDRLAPHAVPSTLLALDAFPLTASGKIDRTRLRERPAAAVPIPASGRTLSATEQAVARAWEETLAHRRFEPDSDFLEVGGTSLNVFALVHRLRGAFPFAAPLLAADAVYRHPTVARLARFLDEAREGRAAPPGESAPVLVSMRKGRDDRAPLFVVAAAGGTLGAYEKLARALSTTRAVIGVRDPFILGDRDPTEGFGRWVERYLDAIRERQPHGPYYLCAYSSAGAFGYELAARLRSQGEEVALLALVDPQALNRGGRSSFGYWALEAVWMRPLTRALVRLVGRARAPVVRLLDRLRGPSPRTDPALSAAAFERMSASAVRDRAHILNLAALLELNTGLPIALDDADLEGAEPGSYLDALQARIASAAPHIDAETIERIAVQYPLQVRAQHEYELRRYDGRVLLVEPVSHYAGLVAALLRPHVRELRAHAVATGAPTERAAALVRRFGRLETHYRCMRDDDFVRGLAAVLDAELG